MLPLFLQLSLSLLLVVLTLPSYVIGGCYRDSSNVNEYKINDIQNEVLCVLEYHPEYCDLHNSTNNLYESYAVDVSLSGEYSIERHHFCPGSNFTYVYCNFVGVKEGCVDNRIHLHWDYLDLGTYYYCSKTYFTDDMVNKWSDISKLQRLHELGESNMVATKHYCETNMKTPFPTVPYGISPNMPVNYEDKAKHEKHKRNIVTIIAVAEALILVAIIFGGAVYVCHRKRKRNQSGAKLKDEYQQEPAIVQLSGLTSLVKPPDCETGVTELELNQVQLTPHSTPSSIVFPSPSNKAGTSPNTSNFENDLITKC